MPEASGGKGEPGELTGNIEVTHAFFRYRPDSPLVLRDLSLSVRPGEFVALVGASGCGKSTLFRLLLGFERLDSGAIHFDGQDLAGMNPQAVRRQMGVQKLQAIRAKVRPYAVKAGYLTEEDINELTRMVATLLYRHLREKQELMTLKKEGDQK